MKIIERKDLSTEKWDALVQQEPGSTFFSLSWYLDATAENWCVITNDDFTFGMALPFSIRLGQETLYTPIFVRYLELFGDREQLPAALQLVNARFKNIRLHLRDNWNASSDTKYCFQRIDSKAERMSGSHAKRMLRRAEKANLLVKQDLNYSKVLNIVHKELENKIAGLDVNSSQALERLLKAAKEAQVLRVYSLENEKGAIACLEDEKQCLYLKGTTDKETKDQGGMYLLIHTAIETALESEKMFDFGGSRAEGVRRFNKALGGSDVAYYAFEVDNSPIWFKFAKRIRNTWKKYY